MKKTLLLLSLTYSITSGAQNWQAVSLEENQKDIPAYMNPYEGRISTYYGDYESLAAMLRNAPTAYQAAITLLLPDANGNMVSYKVWETPVMHPDLASKYPDIKTYTAERVGNRTVTAKINLDPSGFYFMNYGEEQTTVISTAPTDKNLLLVTRKQDYHSTDRPICEHDEQLHSIVDNGVLVRDESSILQRLNGATRKKYSLALATTYEYSVAVTGSSTPTKAAVLAAMVLTLNRVNGVYERDFSATMELVANNDTLIYITSSDPYTNNNGSTMLGQNITTCDARIGNANYDIGHVFSTGGGGVAYLNSLCNTTYKAGGVTGLANPVGDPFAIDYVAHEVGHQFGGPHTFNANTGSCSGNGSSANAFEPGSGTTIMAYAGICGATNNTQNYSDPYFHVGSLRNITNHLNGAGGTCATLITSTNTPNTLAAFASDAYTIPINTPFELTAPAVTDATADTVLYCWEEYDLGGFGLDWNASNNLMPYFRSFLPKTSNVRTFPSINSVLANNLYAKGERIPTAARTLKFVLTVRDYFAGWGSFNSTFDVDTVVVTVASVTDTFKVNSQATTEIWQEGQTKTVTWTVASTNASPINATNVDIYLSIDSAKTFPYHLGTFPNNGSANVVVPSGINATAGRIKVKGSNNIFFQLNRANITVQTTPLAMEELRMDIKAQPDCKAIISWQAKGSADDMAKVVLLKSTDANHYQPIFHTTDAKEFLAHTVSDDYTPYQSTVFYKLAMYHHDASVKYSSVFAYTNNCISSSWALYPNPTKNKQSTHITSSYDIEKVSVYNALGKLVFYDENIQNQSYELSTDALPAGVYIIKIATNGQWSDAKKLIVQ